MTDPVPLGEAIRGLLEADDAVSVHGLNAETKAAFLDAWDAALDAAERRDDEQPAGLSPDVAEATWAAHEGASLDWTLADGLEGLRGYTERAPIDMDALYSQLGDTRKLPSQRITAICGRSETLDWFVGLLPRADPPLLGVVNPATLFAVPLRVDDGVPASTIRLVYGDGRCADTRVRMSDEPTAKPKRRRFSLQRWRRNRA